VYHNPGTPLANLDDYFKMKEGSNQVPMFYLDAKLKNNVLNNGVIAKGMISRKYVQSAVQNVQEYLAELPGSRRFLNKAPDPFVVGYKPELDESPELGPIKDNLFQSHIGILRWCMELGVLTSSLRFQCCPLTLACRIKVTWTRCSMFLPTLRCITALVHDSLVPGNPYNLWISIGVNAKHMDTFESQNSIIGETSV
jgi:hypothetical protein